MAGVPFVFGNATTSIPLSNLDANFNTGVTIGNTTVGLGNTVTTLGNVTLTNATIVANTSSIAANAVVYTTSTGNLTGNASVFTVDSSGNVGIGTASPTGRTTITYSANSAYNTGLAVNNTNSGSSAVAAFQLANDAGNRAGAYLTSSTCAFYGGANTFNLGTVESIPFTFLTGNTERMRIDSSGRLLVGTTTAQGGIATFLSGVNTVWTNCNQAGSSSLVVQNSGTGSSSSAQFIAFQAGTSSTNGTTVGTVSFNGTLTVYATTSDERVKTDNGVATETSVIDDTIIHNFTWKNGVKDKGVFAQEAYKVKPSAVQVGTDDVDEEGNLTKPWGVDYSVYVPDLIIHCQQLKKTSQEQQALITTLQEQVTALQAKVGV